MTLHDGTQRLKRAEGLLKQGFLKDALKILARISEEGAAPAGFNTVYGTALASAGKWAMAATYLKKALQNNLDQPEVLNNLAVCHRALGKYREGLDNLQYALRLSPRFIDAWINKANLHNDLKEPAKAALCFERAVALHPSDPGPWLSLAQSLSQAGQYEKALKVYREAQKLFPTEASFISGEVATLLAQGQFTSATERARQWEQDSPSVAAAIDYLRCLKAAGNSADLPGELERLGQKYGHRQQLEAALYGDLSDPDAASSQTAS
jgi:pentatricopeptide repeat protein